MEHIDDDEFENASSAIEQNVENTLDRVVDDYSHHWKGVIGETLQNSFDGWCTNRFDRTVIPEDQPLRIRLEPDVDARSFTSQDNAGGMPESTFYNDFPGLDTPGEEKQDGGSGGNYGRGAHVVAQLGSEAYAETYHDGFRGGLVVRRARQATVDTQYDITDQGTMVTVVNADVDVLLDLANWEQVQQYVRERFQWMIARDDVTVEYVIDGEVREITPVDLSGFDVLYEEDEVTFHHGGQERVLENVEVYDAISSDESVPFEGISMLKRNEHLPDPFMCVHEYKPRQVRHLDRMFGFADATSLCPEYENNAHNKLKGNAVSNTPLKEILEQLEQEHFIGTPTDLKERDEIVDTTLEVVNRAWENNPFEEEAVLDTDGGVPGQLPAPNTTPGSGPTADASAETSIDGPAPESTDSTELDDTGDGPTDVEGIDLDLDFDGTDEESVPKIKCSTRDDRVDVDEGYRIWVTVENPEASPHTEFDVPARLYPPGDSDLDQDLEEKQFSVTPGEGTSGEDHWEVTPDVAGEYRVRAELTDHEDGETLNTATVTFRAGDPDGDDDPSESTDGNGEQPQPRVSFLEEIKFVPADEEDDFRSELSEGDRGMILIANSGHPEWKHAVKQDGTTGNQNRILTLIQWANNAIVHRMLFDEFEAKLDGVEDADGTPMSEHLNGFVRDELIDHVSEIVATAHREVSG